MMSRHDHSRNAESALHRASRDEGALQRAGFAVSFETFDRHDFLARSLDREDQTGTDRFAVDQYGAGAALAFRAALFGAGEPKVIPQQVEQRTVCHRNHLHVALVDSERHLQRRHAPASFRLCSDRKRSIAADRARRVITSSIATRYSRLPRTSLIGLVFANS